MMVQDVRVPRGLGVILQTTTLKGEGQVDGNLPYTFVIVGGYKQGHLEPPKYKLNYIRPS